MKRTDAPRVAALEVETWRKAYADMLPADYLAQMSPVAGTRYWLRRMRGARGQYWVAVHRGELMGYAALGPCTDRDLEPGFAGEIYALYVRPSVQGRGLGGILLKHGFRVLEGMGHLWGVLWVVEQNSLARRFYEKRGLQRDGARRSTWFTGVEVPVVRYARPLNALDPFPPPVRTARST